MYLSKKLIEIGTTEMSVALERNNSGGSDRIEGPGFVHRDMACVSSILDSPDSSPYDLRSPEVEEDRSSTLSLSSLSSIGNNSDENPGGGSGNDEEEVQSEYKGGPLDSLDSLEEVLPVKKSMSKFYCGKSKSFTSLSDAASCPSIQDITKPENAYTRKRKNLLAFNNLWEKNRNSILQNRRGGISKGPTNSRSMLALTATMNGSESNSGETSNSNSSPPGHCFPPLPPQARRNTNNELASSPSADKFSSWRSFSLFDLQGADSVEVTAASTGLWSNSTESYSHI